MVIQLYLVITYPFPSNARRNTIQTEHRRLHQSKRSLQGRKGPGAGMHCIPGGGVATINDEMSDPVPIPPPKNPPISEVPRFSHIFKFVLLPDKEKAVDLKCRVKLRVVLFHLPLLP